MFSYDTSYIVKQDGTGDYTEIQDAIDAVSNGSSAVIYVFGSATPYSGTDNTNLTWNGNNKHIYLYGVEVNNNKPVISISNSQTRAIYLTGSAINNTDRIKGFEFLVYSTFTSTFNKGGAILIDNNASPIIEECYFGGYGWVIWGEEFGVGGAIYSNGAATIKNCIFEDIFTYDMVGGVCIAAKNGVTIENCMFLNTSTEATVGGQRSVDNGSCVYILPSSTSEINISNCIFEGNVNVDGFGGCSIHIDDDPNNTDINIVNNNFIDETGNSYGIIYFGDNSGTTILKNCIFSDLTSYWTIYLDNGADINFDYCLTYQAGTYLGITPGSNCILNTNPQLNVSTYQPLWTSSVKSPCIDSGDPSIMDDDDTPSDIGAICATEHRIDEISLPSPNQDSGWKWLSFPSLDVVYDDADIAENVLADILNPNILDYVLNQDYSINWNGEEWENINEEFARTEGFKFKMLAADELEVIGFKIADNTPVSLTGEDEDNWIGYWLEDTQSVSDAFSDYWDGENIHYIQHQYWTATYYMDTWWYQCQGGHSPTISYGEMVNIHCNDNITSFRWDNSTPEEQRMMIPETEYYTFEEQANYTPIYVTLDETNLPQEIGAFINGDCVGASIVTEQLCQLNAYTESTSPGNIELELYYGSRSSISPVRLSNYNCQNTLEPNCIQRQINTTVKPEAWFVTLGGNSQTINSIKKLTLDNYPNPFNPTTTISYNIPHEGKVFLEIYNIKGQLVKQLVSGSQPEGYYEVNWNGRDGNDKIVSSGLYFYKLKTEDKIISKKMLLLK